MRARTTASAWVWIAAVAIPLMLLAPALWNGYPLLQYDTGGYLARWYEGYLVPSRSTVFGIYLHLGEDSRFWINLGIQALATLWILQLTLRVFGIMRPLRLMAVSTVLILSTALPWLASMLLTDIFAGLSVLSLFILVLHGDKTSAIENCLLFAFTAFAAATHSATLAVLLGLCCAGWMARLWLDDRIAVSGLLQGSLTIVTAAAMLLSANFALSGQFAWTPGGYGVAFGRMMQDGIVARYLKDHCPEQRLKLCPYRNELPPTADDFLWGHSMFDKLGRFAGLNDEMEFIVRRSLAEHPLWQAEAALVATAQQLAEVATGEGTQKWIPHTTGIIERYLPAQVPPMRAGNDLTKRFGRARDFVPGAHRDQHRNLDTGGLVPGHQAPRAAQAGRQRPVIGAGLIGEGAKRPSHRIGHILKRRRLQRFRYRLAGTAAFDQAHAETAENRRAQPLRLALREPGRYPGAERIAHDVGPLDAQMIHQCGDITGHGADVVLLGIVELAGIAMAAAVERDRAAAVFL